jgi:hypothetical protein
MWIIFSILNYLINKNFKIFGRMVGKIKSTKINDMDNDNNRIVASKFYLLTLDIRNSKTLTNENIEFIETLDKDKLIELVKLYNIIIISLTDFIKNYLH